MKHIKSQTDSLNPNSMFPYYHNIQCFIAMEQREDKNKMKEIIYI